MCIHPSSRIARENLDVFCDTWAQNINDLSRLAKELDAAVSGRIAAEKQAYMSLPRPGVSPKPCMSASSINVVSSGLGVSSSSDYCSDKSSSSPAMYASMPNMVQKMPSPQHVQLQESDRSAFMRYKKSPPRTNPKMVFTAPNPGQPVVLRQDNAKLSPRSKTQVEDEGNISSGSACSEEKRAFEYRISLILDDLQLENETLKQLRDAHGIGK